jgi:outer membrane protein OmpA-like peptidoglycan-associated protein
MTSTSPSLRFLSVAALLAGTALVTGCSSSQTTSQQTTTETTTAATPPQPADSSGQVSDFTVGFSALESHHYRVAQANFQAQLAAQPGDIYDEEGLAAAYQKSGRMDKAVPLYLDVEARGVGVMPSFWSEPSQTGLTVAEVAVQNMWIGSRDQAGNRIGMNQAASIVGPQQQFDVFFEFNRAEITPEGAAVIREAAAAARAGNLTRFETVGHTDTVGSEAYNRSLSDARAAAVKTALIAAGIPSSQIVDSGDGKSDQMVVTPDGVRDAQNRRTEIDERTSVIN